MHRIHLITIARDGKKNNIREICLCGIGIYPAILPRGFTCVITYCRQRVGSLLTRTLQNARSRGTRCYFTANIHHVERELYGRH